MQEGIEHASALAFGVIFLGIAPPAQPWTRLAERFKREPMRRGAAIGTPVAIPMSGVPHGMLEWVLSPRAVFARGVRSRYLDRAMTRGRQWA